MKTLSQTFMFHKSQLILPHSKRKRSCNIGFLPSPGTPQGQREWGAKYDSVGWVCDLSSDWIRKPVVMGQYKKHLGNSNHTSLLGRWTQFPLGDPWRLAVYYKAINSVTEPAQHVQVPRMGVAPRNTVSCPLPQFTWICVTWFHNDSQLYTSQGWKVYQNDWKSHSSRCLSNHLL